MKTACEMLAFLRGLREGIGDELGDGAEPERTSTQEESEPTTEVEKLVADNPKWPQVQEQVTPFFVPPPLSELQSWTRPARTRGPTGYTLIALPALAVGDVILEANPMRRAFSFSSLNSQINATPIRDQAVNGRGWNMNFGGPAKCWTEEEFGWLIQLQWYLCDAINADSNMLYQEFYLS